MACEDLGVSPQVVVHDRDGLLVHDLDVTLQSAGVEIVKTPFRAPDANAHAERWVRSVTGECLDHLILIGLGSLRRTLACYRDFSNHHRPHQGIGNRIPGCLAAGSVPVFPAPLTAQRLAVAREQFLGGLLNSYYRKVA